MSTKLSDPASITASTRDSQFQPVDSFPGTNVSLIRRSPGWGLSAGASTRSILTGIVGELERVSAESRPTLLSA